MAFSRPTLTQIRNRIEQDLRDGLQLPVLLRRSFEKVSAAALAAASHILHGHIQDFAAVQLLPDLSESEFLTRWLNIYDLSKQAAIQAELNVTITGDDGATLTVEDGVFQRSDGFQYTLKSEVTISGTSVSAVLVADEAGDDGNIADGSTLSLASPVSGIDTDTTVDSTAVEGEDAESDSAARTRLLQRIRQPPAGGTVNDYISFALAVSGVTRVWVLPNNRGQGTVDVTFVEDDEDPIFPSPAKVAEVQAEIDEKQPVTADSEVFAPNETQINPTISLKPNTASVQAAVTQELEDLIFREAEVRNAIDPDEVGLGTIFDGSIPLSKINEAISIASGEEDHVLVSPTSNPQAQEGGLLTLGTITFQTLA